jgi:hypothetical protein
MSNSFKQLLQQLKNIVNKFDSESAALKKELLRNLIASKLPINKSLAEYQNLLLFISAHPDNKEITELTNQASQKLTDTLQKNKNDVLTNSGLPYTKTVSTFSHDLLKWLSKYKDTDLHFDSFYQQTITLNDALQFTLPAIEKEITTMEYNNAKLLKALQINKKNTLAFLLAEFDRLNNQPFVKDYFFNALGIYVQINPKNEVFSKLHNRLQHIAIHYQTDILKQFNQQELLNKKLPNPKKLSTKELETTLAVIKNSLALLQRETDPVTYLDEKSFRLYELERGISIAIYEIIPERQLPLESYVGYTLFKNGYPAAYGGSWVLGKRALFGINIFEQFRGGESGFVLCQLLRVYRQVFDIDYFEVEPYQYGKDNPEGISSGAYWFYFRYGFRSLDATLNKTAQEEFTKITSTKGYRTSKEILVAFTKSNIALNISGGKTPVTPAEIRLRIAEYISKNHDGNRADAEKSVLKKFNTKGLSVYQKKALIDLAFLSAALNIKDASKIKLMIKAATEKPDNLYAYQIFLKRILK